MYPPYRETEASLTNEDSRCGATGTTIGTKSRDLLIATDLTHAFRIFGTHFVLKLFSEH